ncbi:hypothetical protein SLE2022_344450 [Rubroshorea leprosula]
MPPIFQFRTLGSFLRLTIWRKSQFLFQNHVKILGFQSPSGTKTIGFVHTVVDSGNIEFQQYPDQQSAIGLQNILRNHNKSSLEEIELALDQVKIAVTEDLILDVLKRNSSDWKLAYAFFKWVSREVGDSLGAGVYNGVLDILGKMHRFEEATQVFDEMSKRAGIVNEDTYRVLLNRYAAADKVEEAQGLFHRRKEFGIEHDLVPFQMLLMYLSRYKHVEIAETLFHYKKAEFGFDIKTLNIILNGWCVLGNVHEAKRFWKDIVESKCKPDMFTFATFIKALTKKGKIGTALELFRGMWEKGCKPDVVICNCIIDALCFKKRIPEALEVFKEMSDRGVFPNVATYNSLVKYLCKNRRMEKVYEMLDEMEEKKEMCLPNDITFNYLLKSLKEPEEITGVLERMERNGCKMTVDTYNLILKLYMDWDHEKRVGCTWDEMEKGGLGPNRCSYTIMIHGLYDKGRFGDALSYFNEMTLKGMVPEPRTKILVNTMNIKLKEQESKGGKKDAVNSGSKTPHSRRKERRVRAG